MSGYEITAPTYEAKRNFLRLLFIAYAILPVGWPTSYDLRDGMIFDFIVIGGGSGGAIVATRLSENPKWNVLLVEAGGEPPFTSVIPGLFPLMLHTRYDWGHYANADPGTAQAHPGGKLPYMHGKVLGGSSSTNSLVYSRGRPADYHEWCRFSPDWDWPTVLNYFKKSEGNQDPSVFSNPYNAYLHSKNGSLIVSRPYSNKYFRNVDEIVMNSFEELGLPRLLEINGLEPEGVSIPHHTISMNGRRSSTAEVFLLPASNRSNLFIVMHTTVTKILINEYGRAYGIEAVEKSGKKLTVYSEKEVILSAGTINSPQLLMLSGIGPRNDIEKFDIDVIRDLPVGRNLMDHPYIPIITAGKKGIRSSVQMPLTLFSISQLPTATQMTYFIPNSSVYDAYAARNLRPLMQTFTSYVGALSQPALYYACRMILVYDVQFCKSFASVGIDREVFVSFLVLLHPLSRGTVKLRSRNPFDEPVINVAYYRHRQDLDTMLEGVKFMKRFGETTYFREVGGGTARLDIKECKHLHGENYWRCYALNTPSSLYHPAGTCAMGAVTDEQLRVLGVQGLRVVDASVMPSIPSGNINAPTMMIAERAADFIKSEYSTDRY